MNGLSELEEAASRPQATPYRVFLARAASQRFRDVASKLQRMSDGSMRVRAAYSIKTNPSQQCLSLARENAMLAEAISLEEVNAAVGCGFNLDEVVYNGPFALSDTSPLVGTAFADSPQAFTKYLRQCRATVPGIRLRPRRIESRFGATWEELPSIIEFLSSVPEQDVGVSFHVRSEDLQSESWQEVLAEVLNFGKMIDAKTRHRVSVLDVGGGRDPASFDQWLDHDFFPSLSAIRSQLPNLHSALVEVGQEVATPSACLVTTVLEDRPNRGAGESVVDASVALLSHVRAYPHPVFLWSRGRLSSLLPGLGRILGCICLEDDVLAVDLDLSQVQAGDRLVFASCGSYDASMSYNFATGALDEVKPRQHAVAGPARNSL